MKNNHLSPAIYAGTFDPITKGHQNLIQRASNWFNPLYIAVAKAHHKKTLFTLKERTEIIKEIFHNQENIIVHPFDGLLAELAKNLKINTIIRGVRSIIDFDNETKMAQINQQLNPAIDTIILPAKADLANISSSLVKEIAQLNGKLDDMVDEIVKKALQQKNNHK